MSAGGYVAAAIAGGLGMYFAIGCLFELIYYRRRADAERWKCQPRRWPTRRKQEILLGAANLTVASTASGLFAHYLANGGESSIYFDLATHGVAFSIATALFYFVVTDGLLYWAHRLMHRKALFRTIHRVHHRWTSPTAFTAMAMHPVEFVVYQSIMIVPLFVLPLHVAGVIAVLLYQNAIALLDHSGVDLASRLPWQPAPRFHDDHHKYFHVNYGQTLGVWDRVFGTWRRAGRVYGEAVFGGKGAALAPEAGPPRYIDYRGRRPDAAPAPEMDTAP
jgi:Delta7-sterol 5-desaturase